MDTESALKIFNNELIQLREDATQMRKQLTLINVIVAKMIGVENADFEYKNGEINFYSEEIKGLNVPMKIIQGKRPEFRIDDMEECKYCSG